MQLRAVLATAVVMAFVVGVRADEEKLPLDKVPKAVASAAKKRFPGAKITDASKEVENGKTTYEVSLEHKGHKVDATFSADGKLELIEKTIKAADLPKAVAATLKSKYPGATYEIVEELTKVDNGKEKLDAYEVLLVTADKKKLEVVLAPDGKVTKEESKTTKD